MSVIPIFDKMVEQFQIVLFNLPQQKLHPGSEVSGVFTVEVGEPREFHYIKVSLIGEAHISIADLAVTDTQKHMDEQVVVWNREQARDRELRRGVNNFPFRFTIPNRQLPPSIEVRCRRLFGKIRYYVEGRIGISQPEFDHVTEAEFPLVEVVDITVPELQRPIGREVQKTNGCCFCASGPITLTAESPRRGYCVGEVIPLTVRVETALFIEVYFAAYLQQVVTYRAIHSRHTELLRLTSGPMARNTEWCPGNRLRVPRTKPTVASWDIMTVEYVLVVQADILSSKFLSVKIPLTIGNVPLRESSPSAPPPEVPPVISSQPQPSAPAYIPHSEPPSELTSYPPPSYKPTSHPQPSHGPTSDSPPSYELTSDPPPSYELALQF